MKYQKNNYINPISIIKGADSGRLLPMLLFVNSTTVHKLATCRELTENRKQLENQEQHCSRCARIYTNIVGSISCQRKGTEAIEIPFSNAPKFVITTNWSVRYDEDEVSTNRRFFEYKFTDFFNMDNTPLKVFGHTLFDDWDEVEWNRFYNFVYGCVGTYLAEGLNRIGYDKSMDNYRAIFSNDVVLNEFERVLKQLV